MCRAVLSSSKKKRTEAGTSGEETQTEGKKERKSVSSLLLSLSPFLFLSRSPIHIFSTLDRPIYLRSLSHPRALPFLLRLLSYPLFFSNHKVSLTFQWRFFFGECLKNRARPCTLLPLSRRPARRTIFDVCASFRPRSFVLALHVYAHTFAYMHTRARARIHIFTLTHVHTHPL